MITGLTDIIKNGENDKLKQLLSEDPAAANALTDQGISLLQYAAYCHNAGAVEILKSYRKDLNIFEAASTGDLNTIESALDKDPGKINSFAPDGFTVLGLASFFGHPAIVKILLDRGADPNIASDNPFKVTPLHSACAISNLEIAELLISHGADVNARQMQGITPLHSAAHNGQTKLAELLFENGANVNAKTEDGQTPLNMAEEKGFKDTAAYIKECGNK